VVKVFNSAAKQLGMAERLEVKKGLYGCNFVLGIISAGSMKKNYQLNLGVPLKNYGKAAATDFMTAYGEKYKTMRTAARTWVSTNYATTAADTDEVGGLLTIFMLYQNEKKKKLLATGLSPKKDRFPFLPKVLLSDVLHMALPDAIRTVIATKHSNTAFVNCADMAVFEDVLVSLLGDTGARAGFNAEFKADYCSLFLPLAGNTRYPGETNAAYGTTAWRFDDAQAYPFAGCVSGKPLPPQRGASNAVIIVTEFRDPAKEPTSKWSWGDCSVIDANMPTCPVVTSPIDSVTKLQ
jgi:hypothetical protein